MKMRETVRHSGKGQFFLGGGGGALPVMRPLSKFSDSCLHSCCRTEEIKFSIKPITFANSKSMIILQNKIQNAINQTHVRVRYQCCRPAYTKWTQSLCQYTALVEAQDTTHVRQRHLTALRSNRPQVKCDRGF